MGNSWNINYPISIADFINEAMFAKLHGYYRTKQPIGRNGDFITAPEISSVFGELIASYLFSFIATSTKKIALVEMGAGNGTLFFDIINTIKILAKKIDREEEIKARIKFNIVEISESLTKTQKEKLQNSGSQIIWHQTFDEFTKNLQDEEIYFISNELFDCFPIHQFIKTKLGWQERLVANQNNELVFIAENFNSIKNEMVQKLFLTASKKVLAKEFDIFEYSFVAINFMQELSRTLQKQGGIALIIDYGYEDLPLKSTLQALKNHQYQNVLQNVGECDITSLVNFDALQNCAKKFNLSTSLTTQRNFLQNLKIEKKQENFAKNSKEYQAISRLVDADKMGELFKCLIVWKNLL